MPKRSTTSGAASLRRRKLKGVLVPLPIDIHDALAAAARLHNPRRAVSDYAAAALEEIVRRDLANAGRPLPPKEIPANQMES